MAERNFDNGLWRGEISARVDNLEREVSEVRDNLSEAKRDLYQQLRRVENKIQYGLGILAVVIPFAVVILRKLLG